MTTTTTELSGNGQRRSPLQVPVTTRRQAVVRNRGRIGAGVFTLALAGLLAALVYGNVGQRHPVLSVTRAVDPGQVITAGDVRVVRVAADADVRTIPSSERSSVVGQRAAVRLLPGSILAPDAVTKGKVVGDGATVIGAVVKPGQYPLGLRAGDEVDVVVTGGPTGDRPVRADIVAVSSTRGASGTAISLAVSQDSAARLAVAGSEGRLLLMVPAQ
ncbi:MAG: SAF domain-containing protein [Acidimicrobiales bacterium]